MPTFNMTKSYSDGNALTEAQLDDIKSSTETFFNITKLDQDNIQDGGIATANLADSAVTTAKINNAAVTTAKLASGVGIPPGSITAYGGTSAPAGWLMCDGSAVSRSTYAALFSAISENFGEGDGSTTFNVPDLRGRFLRGHDDGEGNDPDTASRTALATGGNTGDAVGSLQTDAMQGHRHNPLSAQTGSAADGGSPYSVAVTGTGNVGSQTLFNSSTSSPSTDGANGTPRTSSETRPTNVAVSYIIKT